MDILILVLVLLIPYAIFAIPALALMKRIHANWPMKSQWMCTALAAAFVSPAVIGLSHNLLIVPFVPSLFLENQLSPSPRLWNAVAVAVTIAVAAYTYRKRLPRV